MSDHGFKSNSDFWEFVRVLAVHLQELGFIEAHQDLTRLLSSAWTTSSELFGEIGLASKRIIERDDERLSPCLKEDLERCQAVCTSVFK
jgi:hypothetical protein